jgi:DNA modification methylase
MPELVWDGKYDAAGRRVAPLRVTLPFQTVETVNESAQERQRSLFFSEPETRDWRNRLIWGDKKYALPALLDEFAGAVDLVYLDPPFATGADFSLRVDVANDRFTKEPSIIEQKAYRDTWGSGIDSYLQWIATTAELIHALLADTGSLYLHLDPGMSHPAKLVLDEVFGKDSFRNHITWRRTNVHSDSKRWSDVSDHILYYVKNPTASYVWNAIYSDHSDEHIASKYRMSDPDGRRFTLSDMTSPNPRPNMMYEWKGHPSPPLGWRYSQDTMAALELEGRIWYPDSKDKRPRLKRYLDEMPGTLSGDVWSDINPINSQAQERVGYPTQKPEALLERIILASSNEGDLVLDCVCGSGTTAVVAEKLGRRWIAADLGRFAIHTTRKRLLGIGDVKPFVVQNLGKYERQLWQEAEFGESATARTAAYRTFILDLYHAQPIAGYNWLHGLKQGRMVHVGTVDAPITTGDVKQIVAEFRKSVGTGKDAPSTKGVDLLGWDFAFELNEVARQDAEKAGIDLRLVRIPREVLEKRAVEQGDIRFFELAALSVGKKQAGRKVTLTLENFVIPLDDVPADAQKAVTHWSQWIDYWAVDWDNKGDAFHNEWQAYRTRKPHTLTLTVEHEYDEAAEYSVVVKVIDILGNDTTKALQLKVTGRA